VLYVSYVRAVGAPLEWEKNGNSRSLIVARFGHQLKGSHA
jgi:hypothetical protein